jgi:hypothetical protein
VNARRLWAFGLGLWAVGFAGVHAQMPDPALMHGRAIPGADLPAGTVTVRVVREALTNNLVGQEVQLTADGTPLTAKTDDQGRATFTGVPRGVAGRARAVVNGEELVSEPFTTSTSGGLRVILVAGLAELQKKKAAEDAAAAARPAVKGTVVFNPNTRILMEFRDDTLQVFYVLEIQNASSAPVDIGGPLILDLPSGAAGAATLEGSSPNASVSGDRVTVTGPFAPGATSVQIGFRLLYDSPRLTVEQRWPAAMEQLTVALEKTGAVTMTSPQFSTVGEVNAESGTPFLLASGPAVPVGGTLSIELVNLPVHSPTPRYVALGIALAIMGIGAWFAFTTPASGADARRRLISRRDKLLAELTGLEERRQRKTGLSASEETRRQRVAAELEQIYGELDETDPQGGGKGLAA